MVAILLVPQSIAYAYLAGMPPQYGLYAALIPILLYALFSTSPHVAIGPVAISSILILAGVGHIKTPFSPEYIKLVILTGLLIGIIQFFIGLIKKGKLINLLSFPVITGFTSAAAIIIISSQLKYLFGIESGQFQSLWTSIYQIFTNISETHFLTLSIAIFSIGFILVSEYFSKKIPSKLILVFLGIIVSYFFELNDKGVDIIEFVPSGLPKFNLPSISLNECISLLPTVILVSIIGILETVGIAKALEHKNDFYEIDTDQELLALGISKIGGSFFSALPSSASFSRSAILHQSKARTNISSIITFLFVVLSLLFITPYLFYLPKVILAVIIIYAVINLFEYRLGKQLYRLHKFDFLVMVITFLATVFIGLENGVLIGFIISFLSLKNTKKSSVKEVINVFKQNYAKDISLQKNQKNKAHLSIHDNLHFGNAYYLKELVNKEVIHDNDILDIEITFENHCDMDSSALKVMRESLKMIQLNDKTYRITASNEKLITRFKIAYIRMTSKN